MEPIKNAGLIGKDAIYNIDHERSVVCVYGPSWTKEYPLEGFIKWARGEEIHKSFPDLSDEDLKYLTEIITDN